MLKVVFGFAIGTNKLEYLENKKASNLNHFPKLGPKPQNVKARPQQDAKINL